jgi:hypothetical protein
MTRFVSWEPKTVQTTVRFETRTCDKCKRALSSEAADENQARELEVILDLDKCVSFRHRRDYCTSCLEPLWRVLCELIEVSPDRESSGYGEEEDGD